MKKFYLSVIAPGLANTPSHFHTRLQSENQKNLVGVEIAYEHEQAIAAAKAAEAV
jgi:hypothetical protein